MKTQLPFKSTPVAETRLVGDEDCGVLQLPVYGSLLWHEREAVRIADQGFDMFKQTAMAAGEIARREERSDLRAIHLTLIELMQSSMGLPGNVTDEMLQIRVTHADVLNQLSEDTMAWNDRRQLKAVTALIQNRLGPDFVEWDEVLVSRHINVKLMGYLYDFFYKEETQQARSQDEDRSEVDEDEMLGKSSEESTKAQQNPTGDASIGDSSSSTPEVKSSAGTDSEANQSPESSTPTKRAKSKPAPTST